MKRYLYIWAIFILAWMLPVRTNAQEQELQQLALDIEKLSELKSMLADMKTAYQVLSRGYDKVKGVTQGNFSLHQIFLWCYCTPNIFSRVLFCACKACRCLRISSALRLKERRKDNLSFVSAYSTGRPF